MLNKWFVLPWLGGDRPATARKSKASLEWQSDCARVLLFFNFSPLNKWIRSAGLDAWATAENFLHPRDGDKKVDFHGNGCCALIMSAVWITNSIPRCKNHLMTQRSRGLMKNASWLQNALTSSFPPLFESIQADSFRCLCGRFFHCNSTHSTTRRENNALDTLQRVFPFNARQHPKIVPSVFEVTPPAVRPK